MDTSCFKTVAVGTVRIRVRPIVYGFSDAHGPDAETHEYCVFFCLFFSRRGELHRERYICHISERGLHLVSVLRSKFVNAYIVFQNKCNRSRFETDFGALCMGFPTFLVWRPKFINVGCAFYCSKQCELHRERDRDRDVTHTYLCICIYIHRRTKIVRMLPSDLSSPYKVSRNRDQNGLDCNWF